MISEAASTVCRKCCSRPDLFGITQAIKRAHGRRTHSMVRLFFAVRRFLSMGLFRRPMVTRSFTMLSTFFVMLFMHAFVKNLGLLPTVFVTGG